MCIDWSLTCSWALNMKKKDKVQVPQLNEMLSFHLVLLVKMNNVIPKKIYLMIGIYLKNFTLQKVVHNGK